MPMPKLSKFKRVLIAVAAVTLLFELVSTLRRPPPPPPPEPDIPKRVTLTGEYGCLPHVEGARNPEECVPGLRTDDGTLYALDYSPMSAEPAPHEDGDRISAAGVITPVERLNALSWQDYAIKGIFSVTDSFKVLETP